MTKEEFLQILKDTTDFDFNQPHLIKIGAICRAYTQSDKTVSYDEFYNSAVRKLEELPWEMVVSNLRNPFPDEYPSEDCECICMLDCNEHEVLTNSFKNGNWNLYNKTHIKWWIKL